MRHEWHDLHGTGGVECEVYDMLAKSDYWSAVTDVPCPVEDCEQTVVRYEAGYVPGYRVCMARLGDGYDLGPIRHWFIAAGSAERPALIRDAEGER